MYEFPHSLPEVLSIPQVGPVHGELTVPGSKSLTNRAMHLAALAAGRSYLTGVLYSDDTRFMRLAWEKLGAAFAEEADGTLVVDGCAGRLAPYAAPLYVENAGTAARFLTATLVLGQGTYHLTGNPRMHMRPLLDLVLALRQLRCQLDDTSGSGGLPLRIEGGGIVGGELSIAGDKSSQFVSALMMVAPFARSPLRIRIAGELVSRSYVVLTHKIMEHFGARPTWPNAQEVFIPNSGPYQACRYTIEGDASSASYFFAMAAISGGRVSVRGLSRDSSQGDLQLLDILERMGCRVQWEASRVSVEGGPLSAVDVDMNTLSDVAPTLAVVALFASGVTRIHRVGNMRLKECDRIAALASELTRLGAHVEVWDDGLAVTGGCRLHGESLKTYQDHRMAMALALVGLRVSGVRIENPACVAKTFPDYFARFFQLVRA